MAEQYKYMRKRPEFITFSVYLQRVLAQRGKRRLENIDTLEQHFFTVWSDAQTLHLAQYKQLMQERRELKQLVLVREQQLIIVERENDILREKLVTKQASS